jgi:hypothetical protein
MATVEDPGAIRAIWPRLRGVEPGTTAHGVDGLEAAAGDEPGARIGRHALARPLLDRRGEGFVQRLLCEFEAAEQTDESVARTQRDSAR